MKQAEVVFCGNSLYVSMLAVSLQQKEQLRISMIDHEPAKALPELNMLCPDVVIFKADHNTLEIIDILRGGDIRLMIVVVYPESDSIKVVVGERCFKSSVDNLVMVIRDYNFSS